MMNLRALAFAFALVGCSTTDVTVVVESDLRVPESLDRVEVQIGGMERTPRSAVAELSETAQLPREVVIRHSGDGPLGPWELLVTGFSGGAPVVEESRELTFVEGQSTRIEVFLDASCVGVTCGPMETCVDGACRMVTVDAGMPDGGPVDAGSADAGPGVDAGRLDSGVDSGAPDAGPVVDAGTGDDLLHFPLGSDATVDGMLPAGEWSDADLCSASSPALSVTAYGKVSATHLYVALRILDATYDLADDVELVFDTNSNGGDPDADDRRWTISRSEGLDNIWLGQGTNADGSRWTMERTTTAEAAAGEIAGGWAAELSVPRSELNATGPGVIGFMLQVLDRSTDDRAFCPVGGSLGSMDSLGASMVE